MFVLELIKSYPTLSAVLISLSIALLGFYAYVSNGMLGIGMLLLVLVIITGFILFTKWMFLLGIIGLVMFFGESIES